MNAPAWKQFICRACGLIYDEEAGDPDSGLAPGTRFEDIPDEWVCPLCGVTKSDFELYERVEIDLSAVSGSQVPVDGGIVIVGAGLAGWSVAEALRQAMPSTPITLVSACAGDRYHKPELSIAMGKGQCAKALVAESGAEAARRLGVRLLANTLMVGLSPALHQLRTTRGQLRYSQLILAQGARPAIPASLPADLCWRVNHLQQWDGLQQQLAQRSQRVLVVGAGMIGCEMAEDLARAGHQVTLLDRQAWPLAALLPQQAGERLLQGLQDMGVQYHGQVEVAGVQASADGARQLTLSDGRVFEADVVLAATGLMVESRVLQSAGLVLDKGIVVDPATLQTSAADVYALGDCISLDGQPCRFIEPIAGQARAIAAAIAGQDDPGYQHQAPVIRLKSRAMPVVIYGRPQCDLAWTLLEVDGSLLRMQQQAPGQDAVVLELGKRQPQRLVA